MKPIQAYKYKILKNLMQNFPVAHNVMLNSDHNDSANGFLSEWHLEGSVWTHTMMVLSTMSYSADLPGIHWKELMVAALLHDVGKPFARQVKKDKQKVVFYGHSGISTFLAVDMIDKIDPDFSHAEKQFVLEIINHHQLLFDVSDSMSDKMYNKLMKKLTWPGSPVFLEHLILHRQADYSGNISIKADGIGYKKLEELMGSIMDVFHEPIDDSKMPSAVFMVGLPGSGKSTYVHNNYPCHNVISRDNIVMELGNGKTYDQAWNAVDQDEVNRIFDQRFRETVNKKQNLVIDKTNLTHKGRAQAIRSLGDYKIKFVVIMPAHSEIVKRNLARDGKNIPDYVIKNMMKSFEAPFRSEGEIEYVF